MEKYICPSCGRRYNGKRCGNCYYEHFTEEITHGMHTHAGEPLVIKGTTRKPIPTKKPFDCDKKTRNPSIRWGIVLALVLALLGPAINTVVHLASEARERASGFFAVPEPEPAPEFLTSGTVLYDAGGILVVADWHDGQEYGDGFYVAAQNNSSQNIAVSASEVLVNGYILESSALYCSPDKGRTDTTFFSLSQWDLTNSGIETVQTLSFRLNVYDTDTYDMIAETEPVTLLADAGPGFVQPVDDSGAVLYDQDGIRVLCRGYQEDLYFSEEFTEGSMLFYLENNTNRRLCFFGLDAWVNEESVPGLGLWCTLPPQSRAVSSMYFGLSLEELEIHAWEDLHSMVLEMGIYDPEDPDFSLSTGQMDIPLEDLAD